MEQTSYRILELYSGIGGMHYAFKDTSLKGEVVAAVDINTVANNVYRHNFPKANLLNRNIQSLTTKYLNSLKPDILLMSPPCQPFTRNGLQKDLEDVRTDSFEHLLGVLKDISTLKFILLENVKGFEVSNMRRLFVDILENCEFYCKEFLLSPHQFGVPNSRLRYYCLARRKPFNTFNNENGLMYSLPQDTNSKCFQISDIIDNDVDTELYKLPLKYYKRAFVLDICYNESERSCCFTKAYTHFLEGTGSVYTESNNDIVKSSFNICEKLNSESKEYKDELEKLNLRFFTPKEVSRLMSFPESFGFPETITNKQKYRLLGNSINVRVVSILISFLINSV
ncbi:tRNA (cytosine(38)-C(5))-methyltransferase [Arctopsyche grandis]|uniref:tRNA (cytosine(38)-C(5))-methyltransferase n=1 Tax=Arctopsyche grandis TaxID=121162 RepID=UPI00406D8FC4